MVASTLLSGGGLVLGVVASLVETKGLLILIRSAGGWGGGIAPERERSARVWLVGGTVGLAFAFLLQFVALLV